MMYWASKWHYLWPFMTIKDFSKRKWCTERFLFCLCITLCTTLSSIMTQFRLHCCGRHGVWFFDDRATVAYVCTTARRVEGGHWITWWGRLKIEVHCRREVHSRSPAKRRDRRKEGGKRRERERRRREETEGRSSITF